jgi:hypothetical protein
MRESGPMVAETYFVIQHLILRLHACQEGILGQIIGATGILFIGPLHLLFQGLDIRRQESVQSKFLALVIGES